VSTEIYYFSGTGNSLAVARDIAEKIGASLHAMTSVMDRERLSTEAEALGMVFPVYHKSIPLILKRFVQKWEGLEQPYIFAVCVYGDTPGLALQHLDKLLQAREGQLAAGFGVHLPYNYLTPALTLRNFYSAFTLREVPVEEQQALLASAPEEIEKIAASISARETGVFVAIADPLTRLADAIDLYESLGKKVWLKIAGIDAPTELSFLESRQLMDEAFYADEACNNCGVCAKICPVHNISMVDGRPVWQHRCEQCFACVHWCPQEALQFGRATVGKLRYHHPDVNLPDMVRAASRD